MNVPDPAVYAALPVIGGAFIWIARQFILDVLSRSRPRTAPQMSLGDFGQLADALKRELNGRYMFAEEARDKFNGLEMRLEACVEDLKRYIDKKLKE